MAQLSSHSYTYLLTDLRTNTVTAELPLQSVSYENKLSAVGDASGSIVMNDETILLDTKTATTPGKSGLYILRNNIPVWGGIIWKRNYDSSSRVLQISANTFESYFEHRFQLQTKSWGNTEQLDIARWLVTSNGAAQSVLMDVSGAVSGVRRDRNMFSYEFKTTGTELSQLAQLINGFDYNVIIGKADNGNLTRRLEFYYPDAGVSRDATALLFDFPGSIKNFTLNESASDGGNTVWAIGSGEGTSQISAVALDDPEIAGGWPKIETSRSYKSVSQPSTLQSHADSDRDRLRIPISIFEVTVDSRVDPVFGSYSLGDWARFRMEDIFMSPPLDTHARITGIKVDIDNASGLENVSLTLGGGEVNSSSEEA